MTPYLSNKLKALSFVLIIMVAFLHGYNANIPGVDLSDSTGQNTFIWIRNIQLFLSDGIFRVAVPLFFSISGFLQVQAFESGLNVKNYLILLKKRFFTLIIPFAIISTGYLALYSWFSHWQVTAFLFDSKYSLLPLDELFYKVFYTPVPFQFWFIRFLIEYIVVLPIIFAFIRLVGPFYLLTVFLCWFNYEFMVILKVTDLGMQSFFFFSLGVYLGMHKHWVSHLRLNTLPLVASCILWILWLLVRFNYYNAPVLRDQFLALSILCGITFVWCGYDVVEHRYGIYEKLQPYIPYTFGIFIFHEPLLSLLKKLFLKFGHYHTHIYLMSYLLAPTMAVAIAYILSYWLKNSLPKFYSFISGGR